MAQENFNVWLIKPRLWAKRDLRAYNNWRHVGPYEDGDAPRKIAGPFQEPAEAADIAEAALTRYGNPGESYCELRFNGSVEPHTVIFLLEREGRDATFGVWNTPAALWPIFYAENNPYGEMLEGYPDGFIDEGIPDDPKEDFGKTDEDSKLMDLSNDGSEDEAEDDESDDDEIEDESDDSDEDYTGNTDDDPDEDEINTGDDGDTDDDEGDSDDEPDENGTDEEETEMPRLNIFAKMKGPKGWRKRAEAEELLDRNVFALKVGVLDPEGETPGKQERELVAHVEFIETDESRTAGLLRIKLPTGVTLDDFTVDKGWITASIPYKREDD